jgi:hypothetical protein
MMETEAQKVVSFDHPVTGITHTLYFQNPEFVEIPQGETVYQSLYAVNLMYEIEPALPQGDTLQFNSSIQYTEPKKDDFAPTAVSSIGIIGGACGPASIFYSKTCKEKNVPVGLHGWMLYSCFSAPSFKKDEAFHFVIEGINVKKYDSREYSF